MKYSTGLLLLISLCFLFGAGCAHKSARNTVDFRAADTQNMPSLAVEFTTTIRGIKNTKQKSRWRMVRTEDHVELINLVNNTSELWSKTSQDLWFYSKVFHEDRQVIEYSPVDLNMLNVAYQGQALAQMIDTDILRALTIGKKTKQVYGWNCVVYSGEVDGTHYEVHWAPELAIALRVKTTRGNVVQLTELDQPIVGDISRAYLSDISRYRMIEYTDLGDMERDPFVLKIQHQLMAPHNHHH